MNGVLNYAARGVGNRRGMAYGMASACVAAVVLTVPMLVTGAALVGQWMATGTGTRFTSLPVGLILVVIPTLSMIALPMMGTALGAAGIALSKRDCQIGVVGMVVNIAALLAALWLIIGG